MLFGTCLDALNEMNASLNHPYEQTVLKRWQPQGSPMLLQYMVFPLRNRHNERTTATEGKPFYRQPATATKAKKARNHLPEHGWVPPPQRECTKERGRASHALRDNNCVPLRFVALA